MDGILTRVFKLSIFFIITNLALAKGITPSVLMFHEWDLDACPQRAKKSLTFNQGSIHFLLAGQFIAQNKKITSFCYNTTNLQQCKNIDQGLITKITKKLTDCFSVIPKKINTYITIHLNDSKGSGSIWRNEIIFNPNHKNQGFSYKDFLITPFLKAIKENQLKHVSLSLQGEMGATIFSFPQEYRKLIEEIQTKDPAIKLGISLNYNKISGGIKNYNTKELQLLLDSINFLGFSAYAPISRWVGVKHFNRYIKNFRKEISRKGLELSRSLDLIFSEIGLGGGNWLNDGKTPGKTISEVAGAPYAGIHRFNGSNNPWSNLRLKLFRRRYFLKLKNFLNKPNSPVKSAHIWNAGSWDIHGIYPGTEVFRDLDLVKNL